MDKLRLLTRLVFSGPVGRLSARTMEKRNAESEAEAVSILDPGSADSVLAVGFGPGIGVRELSERMPQGRVAGIDPSGYMVKRATRLNRAAVAAERVRLESAYTTEIPWSDSSFDGAIAVNSAQFWNPLSDNLTELARVLRPGARLVTVTHDWALARAGEGTAEEWLAAVKYALGEAGFTDVISRPGTSEDGHAVVLCAAA